MSEVRSVGTFPGGWWFDHASSLKTVFRVVFGLIWIIDGALKFSSGFVDNFPAAVQASANNTPPWLSGWYSFWLTQANGNAATIVYGVGALELALGAALLFGFMRKIAYAGGVGLSLLIWAVPEGFGGPYGSGTGGTDVGAGVVYALLFLGLIVINSTFGPSRLSIDYLIERRFPSWRHVAEFGRGNPPATDRTPRMSTPETGDSL